jgi:uncharacterized protein (DUF1697 family)
MDSFREAMEELGFTDVESYGMSGNLLFNSKNSNVGVMEKRVTDQFGTPAMIRTDIQLTKVISQDPFDSAILFLTDAPTAARRHAFLALEFESPRPVIQGKTVYFMHPARLKGKRAPFDFEDGLGVLGTARSARVVRQLLARMSKP